MKIQQFVSSLLPTFGKDRVVEDCRLTRTELKDFTIPAYQAALPLLGKWEFKSVAMEGFIGTFGRMVKTSGRSNIVTGIHDCFKPILDNLDAIEEMVDKTYNEEVAGMGLTYLKANLLQLVETIAFVSKFARKFLIYAYVAETAEYAEGDTKLSESLTPAEIEWITANFVSFCTALNIASGNPSDMRKQLNDIPDVVVTSENAGTLSATLGEAKIDPFQMKLIPVWLNPIYHIGMFVAEWQADRYKAAKEEVKLLQLRKLNLEKLSNGKPDAHVQREIKYLESRIQGINYKIAKMEKTNA